MNCSGFKINFSAYLDGELPSASVDEIESHLENCSVCAGMLNAYRSGLHSLRHSVEIEPPPDMFERVMAAVDQSGRQARVIPLRGTATRNSFAAAAVIMIALVGSLLFTGGDRNSVAWSPAVDSTIDVVNAMEIPEIEPPTAEPVKRTAQKAYLASFNPDDEPSFSYGVSNNPVIVESGVSAAE